MKKEKKVHLEWAKAYWPQDYEVVDEMKILEEENKRLKEEIKKWKIVADENGTHYDMLEEENKKLKEEKDKYYAEWHLRHS